jgi:predicted TIM-barrel fold metal-dependent hydrolase
MAGYRIISADSHFTVPVELIQEFLPEGYRDGVLAPAGSATAPPSAKMHLQRSERLAAAMRNMQREGRPAGRAGGYDPHERLKDMDVDRVDAEIMYGLLTGHYQIGDPEERRARVRAYNDAAWEWAAPDPTRLIPVADCPVDPVEDGVAELGRLAKKGYRAALIPAFPEYLGLKPYFDRSYDPLWAAAQDLGIPLSMHDGENAWLKAIRDRDPTNAMRMYMALAPMGTSETLATWLLSDLLERFPRLQFVLVEAGIGWIGYFLERIDTMHDRHGWFRETPSLPSERWYRQGHATFEEDKMGILSRGRIGVRNILWATDYPHPDSTWPESQKVIKEHFEGVPEEERRLAVFENAARLYGIVPHELALCCVGDAGEGEGIFEGVDVAAALDVAEVGGGDDRVVADGVHHLLDAGVVGIGRDEALAAPVVFGR